MSGDHERARSALRALLAEVRDDLLAAVALGSRVERLLEGLPAAEEPDETTVMAAAGYLHHLYTATEAIHERIVRSIDGHVPDGERWHNELLALASVELPGVRPAMIAASTRARLGRLLRFRHFFRHAYRTDLLWAEVEPLLRDAPGLLADYHAELTSFCTHLDCVLERLRD